ncbi:MAG: 3D domain-containing protein [Oscillospiraceae bacterium]|nr:3D domain-containing protein [Oscillospiraceae bacterium]
MNKQSFVRFTAAAAALAMITVISSGISLPSSQNVSAEQAEIVFEAPSFDPESSYRSEMAHMAEEEAEKSYKAKQEAAERAAKEQTALMKSAVADELRQIPADPEKMESQLNLQLSTPTQISRLDVPSWLKFDANGIPLGYSTVHHGRACAYTASPSALMSTGKTVFQGYVAVNPNIIPYGSQLYIVADDGEVYGYAIAADTGYSVKVGDILVDLFMSEYNDCIQWGNKNVSIYVLTPPAE